LDKYVTLYERLFTKANQFIGAFNEKAAEIGLPLLDFARLRARYAPFARVDPRRNGVSYRERGTLRERELLFDG
jgi:hypothetical protein